VHELLATGELRDLLVERLGPEVAPGGEADRARIAERVFGDDDARSWLEGVLWPRVGERVASWRRALDRADPPPRAAVVEVPLLFESGMEAVFDRTIAIVADDAIRAERVGARRHAALAERSARQLSQDEKAQRADFVVRNDGGVDELLQSLSRVLAKLDSP
jgi:dephospho-CoA kinase